MATVNPPKVTGDAAQDAWAFDVTNTVNDLLEGGVGSATTGFDNQGRATVGDVSIDYELRYLRTAYATDSAGANFSNLPQDLPGGATSLFQGIRNADDTSDSTNPTDYSWREVPLNGRTIAGTSAFYTLLGGRDIRWTFADAIIDNNSMRTPGGDWGIQSWNYRTNDEMLELIVNTTGLNVTGGTNATINLTIRGANNVDSTAGYALPVDGSAFMDNDDGMTATITLPVTNATHLNLLNTLMRDRTLLTGNNLPGRLRNVADQQIEVFSGELLVNRYGGQLPVNTVQDSGAVIDLDNLASSFTSVVGVPGTAATIAVGTVTEGSPLSITNSGTPDTAVFDFVIPGGGFDYDPNNMVLPTPTENVVVTREVEIEGDMVRVYLNAVMQGIIQFSYSLSNPGSYALVNGPTNDITITATSTSGTTLNTITSATLNNVATGVTINGNQITFARPNTAQVHTVRTVADGSDSDGNVRGGVAAATSFVPYYPYFFTSSANVPTSLTGLTMSNDSFTVGDNLAFTAAADTDRRYVVVRDVDASDSPLLRSGNFDLVPNRLADTITINDLAGNEQTYEIFDYGQAGTTMTTTFQLVMA